MELAALDEGVNDVLDGGLVPEGKVLKKIFDIMLEKHYFCKT